MQEFIERLEDLNLWSQNHETAGHFNVEYARLLGEIMDMLKAMKMLGAVQAAWLEAEAKELEQ